MSEHEMFSNVYIYNDCPCLGRYKAETFFGRGEVGEWSCSPIRLTVEGAKSLQQVELPEYIYIPKDAQDKVLVHFAAVLSR